MVGFSCSEIGWFCVSVGPGQSLISGPNCVSSTGPFLPFGSNFRVRAYYFLTGSDSRGVLVFLWLWIEGQGVFLWLWVQR